MGNRFHRNRIGAFILVFVLLVGAITALLLFHDSHRISASSPVGKLDFAIHELRMKNRSANVPIRQIVSENIQTGAEFSPIYHQLLQDGYEVSFKEASPPNGTKRMAIAEKKFCTGAGRLTGFCDLVRIVITLDSDTIIDVDGYLFFQSL